MLPEIDAEPAKLLEERGFEDHLYLAALASCVATARGTVVVLDGMDRPDPAVLKGLTFLVDRVGNSLATVVTARRTPDLPVARWGAAGWVTEVGGSGPLGIAIVTLGLLAFILLNEGTSRCRPAPSSAMVSQGCRAVS